jgi:transcriptional regulator with XRE-family HTH domain
MVTRVAADKSVLKWARERNKLSVERAAALLKCEPSLLEKIEKGDVSPNAGLFRRRDFRSFEGTAIELSYETIAAIRKVEARQEALAYLAGIDDSIVAPNLPIHFLKEDAGKLGANFRQQLGFPIISQLRFRTEQAFTNWRILIENLGVAVY